MPITTEDAPEVLPSGGKKIYVSAFNSAYDGTCEDRSNRDECAAKIAWSAVKKKYKKSGEKWVAKAEEFSMVIQKVSFDKLTNEMRWRAVASDVGEDLRQDNMTPELYESFMAKIESGEAPPEEYCSEFWSGGMPYLSIAHYSDLNGKGVPGPTDSVFTDGEVLKAKGQFFDTDLGRKCFYALNEDLYAEKDNADHKKIRISIAFLDWKHRHKKTDFVFTRESIDEICPECLLEMFTGEGEGREFLDGHLIHFALTRIPVNTRTLMEVDKSMATQKDDATSIVGEEMADELEELATAEVGKSEALVIKADEEDEEEMDEEEEDKKKKKSYPKKKSEAEEAPVQTEEAPSWMEEFRSGMETIKSLVPTEEEPHPLDEVIATFRSDFDEAMATDLVPEEKLQLIQESYAAVGAEVQNLVSQSEAQEPEAQKETQSMDVLESILKSMNDNIALLTQRMDKIDAEPKQVPVRRSIQPTLQMQTEGVNPAASPGVKKSETPNLRKVVEMTTR